MYLDGGIMDTGEIHYRYSERSHIINPSTLYISAQNDTFFGTQHIASTKEFRELVSGKSACCAWS